MGSISVSKKNLVCPCQGREWINPCPDRYRENLCRVGGSLDRMDGRAWKKANAQAPARIACSMDHASTCPRQGHHPFTSYFSGRFATPMDCGGTNRRYHRINQGEAKKTLSILFGNYAGESISAPLLPRNQRGIFQFTNRGGRRVARVIIHQTGSTNRTGAGSFTIMESKIKNLGIIRDLGKPRYCSSYPSGNQPTR